MKKHRKNNVSECILQGCCQDVWCCCRGHWVAACDPDDYTIWHMCRCILRTVFNPIFRVRFIVLLIFFARYRLSSPADFFFFSFSNPGIFHRSQTKEDWCDMRGSSLHPASHCGVKVMLLKHLVCAWEWLWFWLITGKVGGSCVIL